MSFPAGSHFDWYASLDCDWFDDQIGSVLSAIWSSRSARGSGSGDRNFEYRKLCLHLLSALYQAYFSESPSRRSINVAVSVSRDKSYYLKTNPLSSPYGYSWRTFDSVFKGLRDARLIRVKHGKQGHYVTRISPSKNLVDHFEYLGMRWVEQSPRPCRSLLVGSRSDRVWDYEEHKPIKLKYPVWVGDSPEYKAMRDDLYRINSEIVRHSYTLDVDETQLAHLICRMTDKHHTFDSPLPDKLPPIPFNLYHVQLRRILNPLRGDDLDGGGRFYGPWWQQIPSKQRRLIRIDGALTVEADYSSIHPRILYAWANMAFPKGDFYDLGLPDWKGKDKDKTRRDIVKRYVNAVINARGRYRLSKADEATLGVTSSGLKELLYKKHSPIKEFFNSGAGLKAQRTDSNIANDVMLRMAEIGEVALPVHDSFIVRVSMAGYLQELMREAFKKHVKGAEIGIDEDIIGYPKYFYHSDDEMRKVLVDHEKEGGGAVDGSDVDLKELLISPSWIQKFGA